MSNILQEYNNKYRLYDGFANKVRQLLEEMISSENISCNAITCRLKSLESLSKKIELKQDKYNSLEDLTDIAGIRIITFYSDDVDKVVELVENEFDVDRENTIDKRQALEPDRFGYCSVHYIVGLSEERLKLREYQQYSGLKCEIQIRTVLQHAWAEIEHDLGYKSEITIPKEIRRNFSRLAGLLEIGDKEFLDIRNYLNVYSSNITEKIADSELDEKELDAIILNEFIKSDSGIKKLNKHFERIFDANIKSDSTEYTQERTIARLQWLGVLTLGQLKCLISNNEADAIEVAKSLLDIHNKFKSKGKPTVDNTIGIFYICYAELLKNYSDYDTIYKYISETGISTRKEFPNELLEVKKKLDL